MLKHRIHSKLIKFGKPCTVTDLFGVEGRRLLERLEVPEPRRSNVTASVALIDDLERQGSEINGRRKLWPESELGRLALPRSARSVPRERQGWGGETRQLWVDVPAGMWFTTASVRDSLSSRWTGR